MAVYFRRTVYVAKHAHNKAEDNRFCVGLNKALTQDASIFVQSEFNKMSIRLYFIPTSSMSEILSLEKVIPTSTAQMVGDQGVHDTSSFHLLVVLLLLKSAENDS